MQLFIGFNHFGAGNFGDDLTLDGFVRSFRATSDDRISACTPYDIASQRRRFPAIEWFPDDEAARARELARADVWIGVGDTPFQRASGPWFLDMLDRERAACASRDVPMVLIGVGVESTDVMEDERARRIARACERIWTRDQYSTDRLTPIARPSAVSTGADLANITLATTARPPVAAGVLGLILGFEDVRMVDFAGLERGIAERDRRTTRWLVQEARSFPYTERWNADALAAPARDALQMMPLDYGIDSIDDFLTNFGTPEVVISTRYHGALVAAWHGSRIVAIERSEKIAALADDLNLATEEQLSGPDALTDSMERARAAQPETLAALASRAYGMSAAFSSWLDKMR